MKEILKSINWIWLGVVTIIAIISYICGLESAMFSGYWAYTGLVFMVFAIIVIRIFIAGVTYKK